MPDESTRLGVSVTLLEEGEINQVEFMLLAIPGFRSDGIDDPDRYYHPETSGAPFDMLLVMSIILMPMDTYTEFSSVVDEINALEDDDPAFDEKFDALYDRYVELAYRSDDWISAQYDKLTDPAIDSTTVLIAQLDEIIGRAQEMSADFTALGVDVNAYIAPVEDLKQFYLDADLRSEFMVTQMTGYHAADPDALMGLVIGAAHSELMIELFEAQNIGVVVLAPLALNDDSEAGDLSYAAYERKTAGLSVDGPGELGALLDGRSEEIKPPPSINTDWGRVKSKSYALIDAVTRAVASGATPPDGVRDYVEARVGVGGVEPPYVRVDYDSIEIIDDTDPPQVIFALTIETAETGLVTVWIRSVQRDNAPAADLDLDPEDLLLEAINRVQTKSPEPNPGTGSQSETTLQEKSITPGTNMIADRDKGNVELQAVSGR